MCLIILNFMTVAVAQRWRSRNLFHSIDQTESYLQAGHYFWFPPSYLVGWYRRAQANSDRPTLRLY
jgi:hypothetical protein